MSYASGRLCRIVLGLLCLLSGFRQLATPPVNAAGGPLLIGNGYVSVCVNDSSDGTGRFSLTTIGGDPTTSKDDNKPLIYGGTDPWTSYTTVRVDGRDYIFGGSSTRRAGKAGSYGTVIEPPVVHDNSIRMIVALAGMEVTQTLSLAKSSTTGYPDTLRVEYSVRNTAGVARTVGLRLVLDTMLGQNDGAPFRLPTGPVDRSLVLTGASIPDFWQAFDSLTTPTIRAQGTLRGDGATVPDQLILSDWGTLADDSWTSDIPVGRDFIRKGEEDQDTATALVWESATLRAGESRRYSTYYGLGGVTVSYSNGISLGVTSPADVLLGKGGVGSVPVVAYIENGTTKDIQPATVAIRLPSGASLEAGQPNERLVRSIAGLSDYQCAWDIVPPAGRSGPFSYEVQIITGGRVINRVSRSVNIQGPPALAVWVDGGPAPGVSGVVRIKATVKNLGNRRAEDAVLAVKVPKELIPARNEVLTRAIGFVEPGASVTANWVFYTDARGSALVSVTAASTNANDAAETRVIRID